MIDRYGPWLRWWLMVVLISIAGWVSVRSGVIMDIAESDITWISFLILTVFVYFTVRTGIWTYQASIETESWHIFYEKSDVGWFAVGLMPLLGMIGTVIGFIYMLLSCFQAVDAGNVAKLPMMISQMSIGMGTALYTTAVGLICGLLLRIQLYNLKHYIDVKVGFISA